MLLTKSKELVSKLKGQPKQSVEETEKIAARNKNYNSAFLAAIQPQGVFNLRISTFKKVMDTRPVCTFGIILRWYRHFG